MRAAVGGPLDVVASDQRMAQFLGYPSVLRILMTNV